MLCRKLFKSFIIILPLLGFTWVFGVLAVDKDTLAFAMVFIIFNSLQVSMWHCMYYIYIYTISDRSLCQSQPHIATMLVSIQICRGQPFSSVLWCEVTKCGPRLSLCASSASCTDHRRVPRLINCLHHMCLLL